MSHQSSITITSLCDISDKGSWLIFIFYFLEVCCGGQATTPAAQQTILDIKA